MSSLQELLNRAAAIDKQIAQVQKSSRTDAIARIRLLMAEHGLTAIDIAVVPGKSNARGGEMRRKVAPKFRDSQTGATWSGRGLKPRWLAEALMKGKTLEDFAI